MISAISTLLVDLICLLFVLCHRLSCCWRNIFIIMFVVNDLFSTTVPLRPLMDIYNS